MFPLEMYAPKSNVSITGFDSPNVVGAVGKKSVVTKKEIDPKIDKLIIKLGEEVAAQSLEEEEKVEQIETKIEQLPEQLEDKYKLIEVSKEELEQQILPEHTKNANNSKNESVEEEVYIEPELPHFSPEELAKMTYYDAGNIDKIEDKTSNKGVVVEEAVKAPIRPELPYFDDEEISKMNADVNHLPKATQNSDDTNLHNPSYSGSKQATN
jgi:hypothetical protein